MKSTFTRSMAIKMMAALLAAEVLSAFELSMLYSALRFMIADFGSPEQVGWVMTSFLLSSAVSAAICGRLGDLYGRKKVLLVVVGISIIGSLIAGFSNSIEGVVCGRIIQGMAGAIFPLCIGLVRESVSDKQAPVFIGTLAVTFTVTMGAGAFAGGVIVDTLSWHWIFYLGAVAGAVAFITIYYWMPAPAFVVKNEARNTNFAGGVLFAPAIALLLLGITKGQSWGWDDHYILSFLAVGVLLLLAWIQSELRAENPLINVRLLANRQVLLVNLCSAILGMTSFQLVQVWSIVLQQPVSTGIGFGISATLTGLVILPKTLIALLSGPTAGFIISRRNGRMAMTIGASIMALGWIILSLKHDSVAMITGLLVFLGFGMSMVYAGIPILISQAVPLARTSEANGMMSVIRYTAMGIGAQLVAALLNSSTVVVEGAGYPDATALNRVLGYIIAGSVAIVVIAMMLPTRRHAEDEPLSDAQQA